MEVLNISSFNTNAHSISLVSDSPTREKSPQQKLNSKYNHLVKIPSNLQYVPKKPSSPTVDSKSHSTSDALPSNTASSMGGSTSTPPPTPSPSTTTTSNPISPSVSPSTTKVKKSKKVSKKTKPAVTPKASSAQNNNSTKKNTRAPLSTIYDSNSNTPKRAEYRPVTKNNSENLLPDELSLNKLKISPNVENQKVEKSSLNNSKSKTQSSQSLFMSPFPAPFPAPFLAPFPAPKAKTSQLEDPLAKALQASATSATLSSLPPTEESPPPTEESPPKTPGKKIKVYEKKELLVIGKLPICSVPPPGKSPSEIIAEYNLLYVQQENNINRMQEEEKSFHKQSNNTNSNYNNNVTHISESNFRNDYSTHSVTNQSCPNTNINIQPHMNNTNNNTNSQSTLNSFNKKNKKAWVPRKSTDSFEVSSADKQNVPSFPSPEHTLQKAISQNNTSPNQNSPKYYSYNHIFYHNNFLFQSQQQANLPVVFPTDYEEGDQNEYSDEEYGFEQDQLQQYLIQEISPKRLESRQKQIDIGKNTPGYKNYNSLVKKERRKYYDPHTPDKHQICSKRSWDGQIRVWRRLLHHYDPKKNDNDKEITKE